MLKCWSAYLFLAIRAKNMYYIAKNKYDNVAFLYNMNCEILN